jgi:hypothetical protein
MVADDGLCPCALIPLPRVGGEDLVCPPLLPRLVVSQSLLLVMHDCRGRDAMLGHPSPSVRGQVLAGHGTCDISIAFSSTVKTRYRSSKDNNWIARLFYHDEQDTTATRHIRLRSTLSSLRVSSVRSSTWVWSVRMMPRNRWTNAWIGPQTQ